MTRQRQFGVNGIRLKNFCHTCTIRQRYSFDPKPEKSPDYLYKVISHRRE